MPSLSVFHAIQKNYGMTSSKGLLYALSSAASYGLMSFLIHWNPSGYPVEQLLFIRGVLSGIILLPFCYTEMRKYFRQDSIWLWIRAFAGAGGVVCYYYALQGTASANANLIFGSSPLFVTLFAWLLFRETLTLLEFLGVLCILLANVLLYLPNQGTIPAWVWLVGGAGAIFASIAFLSLGAAVKRYSVPLIVFGFAVVSGFLALLLPGKQWILISGSDIAFLAAVSLLGLFSQLTATASFTYLKSPVASSLGRTSILFSGIFDIFIARYEPHLLEWTSYFVVVAGVYLSQQKPKKNR